MVTFFKPAGIPVYKLDEIQLTVDELEAMRLADLEGLYQDSAAKEMHISRQTFGRILVSAHKKVAETLVHGKSLIIEGGEISMPSKRKFQCFDCKHTWEEPFGTGRPEECPACQSNNFHRVEDQRGFGAGRRGGGNRRRVRATHTGDS